MKEERGTQQAGPRPRRIAEDRAAKILERAAALHAKRNSEIEVDQLREAAEDAGISRGAETFDIVVCQDCGLTRFLAPALRPARAWLHPRSGSVSETKAPRNFFLEWSNPH